MPKRRRRQAKPGAADPCRVIRLWLWLVAAGLFAMVLVGAGARLSESGLPITQWTPNISAMPPLSAAGWSEAFDRYRQNPQYLRLFPELDLARFETIYLWEWSRRLLERLIGALFALPFLFFWWRGRIVGSLRWRLAFIFALVALQAFADWGIDSSGLVHRVEAAPQDLAIRLLLSSSAFAATIWTAIGLAPNYRDPLGPDARSFGPEAGAMLGLSLAQTGLGGLVAGLRAGFTYNSWPLMDGHFIPPSDDLLFLKPWAANFIGNVTMVQFQHRMAGYVVLALALFHAFHIGRETVAKRAARRARVLAGLMAIQAGLGIAALLLVAPPPIVLAHQAFAMIVLAMATIHLRKLG